MNNINQKSNAIKNVVKGIIPYVIIVIVVVLLRTFIITPVIVDGDSMDDTLTDGQIILLKKYDKKIERNDIIVFSYEKSKLVKRVIGLPGDHIRYENGTLYINGEYYQDDFALQTKDFDLKYIGYDTIPEGYYFVLGDNREYSIDSRRIGLIAKENIDGITDFSLWPLKNIQYHIK